MKLSNRTTALEPFPKAGEDKVFAKPLKKIEDFNFGKRTAEVFDDMLDRSVPFYEEIQRMVGELVADYVTDRSNIYDLGCSTCNTFLQIGERLPKEMNVRFIGIDSSQEMLEKAKQKLIKHKFNWKNDLLCKDINQKVFIENASAVMMILTLQFIRPLYRDKLLRNIYLGLNDNGCAFFVEKVLGEHTTFNRLFIKHYYEMKKRHGYSELEIAQKREALENVLVPYRLEENKELLRNVGFKHIDVFFKWYNFCGVVAMK